MEDHDDFEIVDTEKSGFEEFVDDEALLVDDEMDQISALNKEMREVQELKQKLKAQCTASAQLINSLQEQSAASEALQAELKQQILSVNEMKASLKTERQQFETSKQELSRLMADLTDMPATLSKARSLQQQLEKFSSDTSSLEAEVNTLKSLRVQQEEMIRQCKIHTEMLRTNQRECLIALDKSKSFTCKDCGTDIGLEEDIESKCYQVGQGQFNEQKRGYLFRTAVNLVLGATKSENFTTGSYQISWASCAKCNNQMGWKYISAENEANSAKVNKFCLARYNLLSPTDRAHANSK